MVIGAARRGATLLAPPSGASRAGGAVSAHPPAASGAIRYVHASQAKQTHSNWPNTYSHKGFHSEKRTQNGHPRKSPPPHSNTSHTNQHKAPDNQNPTQNGVYPDLCHIGSKPVCKFSGRFLEYCVYFFSDQWRAARDTLWRKLRKIERLSSTRYA